MPRWSRLNQRRLDEDALQDEIRDPDLPLIHATPLAETTRAASILLEFMSAILLVFGAAGMTLAALGIYGLVSYTVRQRTRDIGIRMALGATGRAVVRECLGSGLRLGAMGTALGVVSALAVSRRLENVVFGVSATDVVAFSRVVAIVLGGVSVTTIVPAWRASPINPLIALRHQ